jgi:hypothetical protein
MIFVLIVGPEIAHRGQPIGIRILLASVTIQTKIGGPTSFKPFSCGNGGYDGITSVLVVRRSFE